MKDKIFKRRKLEDTKAARIYIENLNHNGKDRDPTIEEMRRVAKYLSHELGQYSAAGKLLVKADLLERAVEDYLKEELEGERAAT